MIPPQPVARLADEAAFAVAGDRVVYAGTGRRAAVLRDDRGRVLGRARVPGGDPDALVSASPERVAVGLVNDAGASGVFAGPPAGPLAPLLTGRPAEREVVAAPEVDGPRVFAFRLRLRARMAVRWTVTEPGRAEAPLPLLDGSPQADFAGDRVAFSGGRRLVVANWRTGAVVRRYRGYDPDRGMALRADGTLAFVGQRSLFVAPLGGPARERAGVSTDYGSLAWAGDRLVLAQGHRLAVVGPGGGVHRLGPRTGSVERVVTDGADQVAWVVNGCLVTASAGDGPADAIGRGPCHRTELDTSTAADRTRDGVRRLRIPCLAGPGGVCRVRAGRRRIRIRAGHARRLRIPAGTRVRLVDPGSAPYALYPPHFHP